MSTKIDPSQFAAAIGAERLGKFDEVVAKLSPEQRVECATHFEVGVKTVESWGRGKTSPHPRLQKQVITWIRKRLAS